MDDLDSAVLRRLRMLWTSSVRVSSQYCTSACSGALSVSNGL
jgi:hypothetical protein